MKKVLSLFVFALLMLEVVACAGTATTGPTTAAPKTYINPETLKVQLIPSKDIALLEAQKEPLQDLLSEELGMNVLVTVTTDYKALIETMKAMLKLQMAIMISLELILLDKNNGLSVKS